MESRSDRVVTGGKYFRRGGEKWLLKGVTYGPFAGADRLPARTRVEADLRQMVQLGINTLRLYALPPRWLLDLCADHGLAVMGAVPWAMNVDFLRERRRRRAIVDEVRRGVAGLAGHPALIGWFLGNEVPSTLVRWMGGDRVQAFLQFLTDAARAEEPGLLYTYATYPSTEYLIPANIDFVSFNVYLEERDAFSRYLARLQNLAGDRPLVISEFGLDTRRNGEAAQAETMLWAWEESLRGGAAGFTMFSFTDEWFNGGTDISDWEFGLTTRARRQKEAFVRLSGWLPHLQRPGQAVRLRGTPRISVIVCTHNGSRLLRAALESAQRLIYPDFEVIVVDDGSTDAVPEIVAEFREVRYIRIAHSGLSAARNRGAMEATGEILAYTDDDCEVDEEWLLYLAEAFERPKVGAAGGPNIASRSRTLMDACVVAAPGGPAHVLFNDSEAEHLPGCNLAVTKAAWEDVRGFDPAYRTAGDDVDFCWRLLDHGYRLAFHGGAMVWHHRRNSFGGYLKQQRGYGEAEALLIARHRGRFGQLGGARWLGTIYEPAGRRVPRHGALIYRGTFGYAPFQFLYAGDSGSSPQLLASPHWALLAGAIGLGAVKWPWLSVLATAMVLATLSMALHRAWTTRAMPPASGLAGKLVLTLMWTAQPFTRNTARVVGCLLRRVWPGGPWIGGALFPRVWRPRRKTVGELASWSGHGRDRDHLTKAILTGLEEARWEVRLNDGWEEWDFEVRSSPWWKVRVTTVTEFIDHRHRLTRLRLSTKATPLCLLTGLGVPAVLMPLAAWFLGGQALWFLGGSFLLWMTLEYHHGEVAGQIRRLALNSAADIGLRRLDPGDEALESEVPAPGPHGGSPAAAAPADASAETSAPTPERTGSAPLMASRPEDEVKPVPQAGPVPVTADDPPLGGA